MGGEDQERCIERHNVVWSGLGRGTQAQVGANHSWKKWVDMELWGQGRNNMWSETVRVDEGEWGKGRRWETYSFLWKLAFD